MSKIKLSDDQRRAMNTVICLNTLYPGLGPLTTKERWVIWRWKDGSKVPYQSKHPNRHASSTDASTWSTYREALDAAPGRREGGIGFVLGDGVGGLDLDACIEDDGKLHPWARDMVHDAGSYAEVTPSRRGARIIGYTNGGYVHEKTKMPTGSVELYRGDSIGRYITITGTQLKWRQPRQYRCVDRPLQRQGHVV